MDLLPHISVASVFNGGGVETSATVADEFKNCWMGSPHSKTELAATVAASKFRFFEVSSVEEFEQTETALSKEGGETRKGIQAKFVHHFLEDPKVLEKFANTNIRVNVFYEAMTLALYISVEGVVEEAPNYGEEEEEGKDDDEAAAEPSLADDFPIDDGAAAEPSLKSLENWLRALLESAQTYPGTIFKREEWIDHLTKVEERSTSFRCVFPGKLVAQFPAPSLTTKSSSAASKKNIWVLECSLAAVEEFSAQTLTFAVLHRRIEWLMHFFIDALSPLEADERWRIFVAVSFWDDENDPIEEAVDQTMKEVEAGMEEWRKAPDVATLPRCLIGPLLQGTDNALPRSSDLIEAAISHPTQPYRIIGMVSVYQFFSLPADRARISQFFVLPQCQGSGIGRSLLMSIMDVLTGDSNIREITVEDPSAGFQKLRDTCSCLRAIEIGLFDDALLFPPNELKAANRPVPATDVCDQEEWPKYAHVLKTVLKECRLQRNRLRVLLELATLVPTSLLEVEDAKRLSLLSAKVPPHLRSSLSSIATMVHAWEWQVACAEMKPVRLRESKRLRLASLEWYQSRREKEQLAALEDEWRALFLSICFALKALRKLYKKSK